VDLTPTGILSEQGPSPLRADVRPFTKCRHFELILDIGEALAIASAIHAGQLVNLVEHLCLDHVWMQLTYARELRTAALVPVDNCLRACVRCAREDEARARLAPVKVAV
jgi:hypothetical protein